MTTMATMARAPYIREIELPILFSPDEDMSWRDMAECRNTSIDFFARSSEVAKDACSTCPVIKECLSFAVRNNERFGIWGGMTYTERQASLV